jgi:biopolymer transport protein TolR
VQLHQAAGGSLGRGRPRRVASSLSEINVVPLVDVMLVLLIIFMVTAPLIQRGIDVNLPVARRSQTMEGERLEVTVPMTYRQDHKVFFGSESIRAEVLQERVRQKMATSTKQDVYLRSDNGVSLGEFFEVIDVLKAAGVEHVGLVTRAPER